MKHQKKIAFHVPILQDTPTIVSAKMDTMIFRNQDAKNVIKNATPAHQKMNVKYV